MTEKIKEQETGTAKIPGQLPVNQETLDILVANIIPTSKYFETRFDHLESRVNRIQDDLIDFRSDVDKRFSEMKTDVDKRFSEMKTDMNHRFDAMHESVNLRFEQVDRRFEQVDKRFEQVDKRFEQIDRRFDQVNQKLDTIIERLDVKIDNGLRENRALSIRLFSFAMVFAAISMAGLFARMTGLF